jgi:hypothetical protein
MTTDSRIFLKPEVILQPTPTFSATGTTQHNLLPYHKGLEGARLLDPPRSGDRIWEGEIRGLLLLAPGDGTARRRRQVQRDCLQGNQADATFKFMECLLHACPQLRLQENSKRVHSVLLLGAEGLER